MTLVTGDTTLAPPTTDGLENGAVKPAEQQPRERQAIVRDLAERRVGGPRRITQEHPVDTWTTSTTARPHGEAVTPPAASATSGRDWRSEPPAVPGRQAASDPTSGDNVTVVDQNGQSVRTLEEPLPQKNVQSFIPTAEHPLADFETEEAARYFQHLDIAFADIDAHRGVMHGPMQWPQPDTPAGQERVEGLISKLFRPKERPESAYTTLILYMPSPGDPKRLEKIAGFATAVSRQLRTMVEQGALPLATATVLHQSLARHAASGSHPKDAQQITRMFERKRLEVVSISASPR